MFCEDFWYVVDDISLRHKKVSVAISGTPKAIMTGLIWLCSTSSNTQVGPPEVLGIWGEWLFIFRELGSTGNYHRGAEEQAHSFGDLGSPAKKQKKNKGKASILLNVFIFL